MPSGKLLTLCGEENYFIEQAVRDLKAQYVDPALAAFALDIITEKERDINRIINSVQLIPSFAPRRLVLIYEPFFMTAAARTEDGEDAAGPLAAAAEKLLYSALENIPDGVLVVFVLRGKVDQRKKWFKFLQSQGEVRKFESFAQWDRTKVADWLSGYLRGKNIDIEPAAADFLVEVSGVSIGALVNEAEKILTYAAGKNKLTLSDVQAVASQGELNTYALGEALRRRDAPEILALTARLLRDGEAPQLLLGFAVSQLRLLLQIKELQQQKKSYNEIAGLLKRNPFYVKIIMEKDLPRHSLPQLKNAYYELQNADLQMKTGLLEPRNALLCALAVLA
ncbi:MAG: DNA polymerase III subunit delta [Candidatus Margulisbacteria bacterium]|jgi:DNA polymerase-3 subunit delta|nr:DNA polymerase III subunit delta [Candidatus Margulisiibacteriota bacterium]